MQKLDATWPFINGLSNLNVSSDLKVTHTTLALNVNINHVKPNTQSYE